MTKTAIRSDPASKAEALKDAAEPELAGRRILPHPISPAYRLSLLGTSTALFALPLIYFSIVAAIAYGVYFHFRYDFAPLSGGGVWGLVAYIAPGIVGPSLIWFMLRPFFEKRRRGVPPREITVESDPMVFELIDRVCDALRAPRPRHVRVDLQPNASASLTGLRGLFRREVDLTIGLPLAACLTVDQFGAVLAHEFAHFAQGAGMRLNYIIRVFNSWIARIAYQPAVIEQKILVRLQRIRLYVWVIALALRISLWFTRRLLRGLLLLSHAISCYAMRQMEHDADLYEAKVAGPQAFGAIMDNLRWLNGGAAHASLLVQTAAAQQRGIADFVELIKRRSEAGRNYEPWSFDLPARGPTRWFNTHPSPRARIEYVSAVNSAPLLTDSRPATLLFANFDALSREITREFYTSRGVTLDKFQLQELDAFCAGEVLNPKEIESVNYFFSNRTAMERPFSLTAHEIESSELQTQDVLDREWESVKEQTEDAFQAFLGARLRIIQLQRARAMVEARIRFDPPAFCLSKRSRKEIDLELEKFNVELAESKERLQVFDAVTRRRLAAALRRSTESGGQASYTSFLDLLQSLHRLAPRYEVMYESLICLGDLLNAKQSHRSRTKAHSVMIDAATSLTNHLKEIVADLNIPNPVHGGTVGARVTSRLPSTKLPYERDTFVRARACLRCLSSLYFQCVARICTEAAAGLAQTTREES